MSLNHDGQRFLCGSTNPNTGKLAGVADLSAGPPFQILNGSGGLVAQSADGSVFVQGNGGDVLFLWKRGETTPYAEIPTGGWIGDVAVSPNGRWGVFSQQDSWKLCFFDLATKSIIRESPPHAHAIMSMAISPDSQWLGYLSDDTSLRLMPGPGATDTPKQTEWWGHAKTPTGITFLQDRHHLATTSSDGSLRLWHVTGTNESTYPSAPSTASNRQSLLFSPDGNWLAGTQWEGKVSVTNLHQRKTIELPISSGAVLGWTPAMELLVATTAAPRPVGAGPFFITRWAFTKTGPSKLESDPVRLENSDGPYGHWRLHQDGQLLVAADIKQQSVTVWNLQTGQCHGSDPMEGNIQNLAWSPNADRIAGSIYGVALIVAQSEDGGRLFTKRAAAPVHWLEFSPDGKMLAAANYRDRKVCLFNSASGKELAELNGHTRTVTQALFAPDGKILVTVSQDKTVRLWHLPTRRELTTLTTNAHYERVAISYGASGPRIIYLNESHAVRSLPDELFEH
jgi:WD40 repeat protein